MGVCKCKKRTDLWCRRTVKPVCLDCIVDSDHQLSTIIQYVDWLNNPIEQEPIICPLTKTPIVDPLNSIRFTNLQIFHLDAIIEYCSQFPLNTAAAGFVIPGSEIQMLPASNDQSALANQIREKLKKSPIMARIIESQKEQLPQINQTDDSSSSVTTRKNAKQSDADVIISMPLSENTSSPNVTASRGGKRRLVKKIRAFLKGVKLQPKMCIMYTILFFLFVYLFLYFFQKTLNLVEYELFAWLPDTAGIVDPLKKNVIGSNEVHQDIIQNS